MICFESVCFGSVCTATLQVSMPIGPYIHPTHVFVELRYFTLNHVTHCFPFC